MIVLTFRTALLGVISDYAEHFIRFNHKHIHGN
jgi:hypothetical protein